MGNVWKIAPGRAASHWGMCRSLGCIALGWRRLNDYNTFSSEEEIQRALGGGPGDGVGAAQSIWRFAHVVQPSDLVVANQGRSRAVGIGVVRSEYLPPGSPKNPSMSKRLPHARLVNWIVDLPIDLDRFFFGIATVHLLGADRVDQIISAYQNRYPTFGPILDQLFRYPVGIEPERAIEDAFEEGVVKYHLHRRKERNQRAVQCKKESVLAKFGMLACEVCDFDFSRVYGSLGSGFAECHHRMPLKTLEEGHRTRLRDLAIVCANCHRMLHKSRPMLSVEALRVLIESQ